VLWRGESSSVARILDAVADLPSGQALALVFVPDYLVPYIPSYAFSTRRRRLMPVEVIPPEGLRSVPGLDTPQRFYRVLQAPASFAGMAFPDRPPWKAVAAAGFESIVCLTDNVLPYDPSPLRLLRALKFKDLIGGARPDNPQREADMLRDVVQAVVGELRAGRGVVVHCAGGTGRTGTVIACSLAALGMPEAEVLSYMATVNVARRKSQGWPESDWQKSQVANFLLKNA
jgi:protein-tyrosine phosphatase